MTARRVAAGLAGGAVLIAAVTVVARAAGFGRWLVFSSTVEAGCLGTAYTTANLVPNIVFEVVAGGALAGTVVPLVAGPLGRGDAEAVRRTASALLTWTVLALVPVAAVGALLARPVMAALLRDPAGCDATDVLAVAAGMFLVFAPQVPLYGVAVVCGGLLNAHGRFLAPALGPLLSTVVVAGAYLAYGARGTAGSRDLARLDDGSRALLAWGTTAGVLVLALTTALPAARLGLRLRPTLRFPGGTAARARSLAAAGLATLVAQQLTVLAIVVVANGVGGAGALPVYTFSWAVVLLPWAVLAVPIATASFTRLSEQAGRDDRAALADTAATTTRAVLLASFLGAALVAGTAGPVAQAFLGGSPTAPAEMAWALLAFAPGLVGYGLVAHLGRALYAVGAGRAAASATVAGWLLTVPVALLLLVPLPGRYAVAAIGAGTSVGMSVAGAGLLASARGRLGAAALAGVSRVGAAAAVGAALAAAAGAGTAAVLAAAEAAGLLRSAATAAAAGMVVVAVFGLVVGPLGGTDVRALVPRRWSRG